MKDRPILVSVVTLTLARVIINIGRRFAYPFIPAIARQLGVPLSSVQNVIAAQAGAGVASPIFGPLSERYGRKRVLMGSILLMSVGSIIGALIPQFWIFALVMILFGVSKMVFDPALLAYLGDRVPYNRRGMAIGTTELSWAGSLVVAAPVAGALLSLSIVSPTLDLMLQSSGLSQFADVLRTTAGIQAIFAAISVGSAMGLLLIWLLLPADHPEHGTQVKMITPWQAWPIIWQSHAAMGAMAYSMLLAMGNEVFFINYGAWMEISFDLVLATLGAATTVIAVAEILGEFTVISFSDRFGKRRLALIGSGISSACYFILPLLNFNLTIALIGLFVMFLSFETGIVASIPLFTEVLPDNRAIMMSSNTGAASFGRLVGAVAGGALLALTHNFVVIGIIAMTIGFTAFFTLWHFVHE